MQSSASPPFAIKCNAADLVMQAKSAIYLLPEAGIAPYHLIYRSMKMKAFDIHPIE